MNKVTSDCNKALNSRHVSKPEMLDWGVRYIVTNELTAFQVAYAFRNNKHGVKVEFCPNIDSYSVTIFNEFSTTIGIDRS